MDLATLTAKDIKLKTLTPEEKLELIAEQASLGTTITQASKLIGLSDVTIRKYATRHGITFRSGRDDPHRTAKAVLENAYVVPETVDRSVEALDLGKAGEHLVCADLLSRGYQAFLSDQGMPYDVIADNGGKLIRIQVKTSAYPKNANASGRAPNLVYNYAIRRRGKDGKSDPLSRKHCDVVALVALAHRVVAYFSVEEIGQTMAIFPPGWKFYGKFKRSRDRTIENYPPERVLGKVAR